MRDDLDLRDFDGRTRLFPLPGVVCFPHVVLPLHIFEPRYRQMTQDALASDKLITIVQVRPDADWNGPGEPAIESVGCLGRILQHELLPDGRYNFLLLGRKRVRLVRELEGSHLYREAVVEILEDVPPDDPAALLRAELVRLFRAAVRPDAEMDTLLRRDLALGALCDLIAHALALPPALKQGLLAEPKVEHRARTLCALLAQVVPSDGASTPGRRPEPPFSLN
jgi:Lon protease-like protein